MPVSRVSFTSAIGAMDKVSKEQLYNPGLYSMPELMQPPPREYQDRMSFLGFLGRVILTAGIFLGAPLLARKNIGVIKDVDLTVKLSKDAKIVEKLKYHVAKFGEWVDKNMYQKLINAINKKSDEVEPKLNEKNPSTKDGAEATHEPESALLEGKPASAEPQSQSATSQEKGVFPSVRLKNESEPELPFNSN